MKKNKGFSLVELIIVIAIMAILVGVIAPQLIRYIEKANISADVSTLDSIRSALTYAISDPEYATSNEDVGSGGTYGSSGSAIVDKITGNTVSTATTFKSKDWKGSPVTNVSFSVEPKTNRVSVELAGGTNGDFTIGFDGSVQTPSVE